MEKLVEFNSRSASCTKGCKRGRSEGIVLGGCGRPAAAGARGRGAAPRDASPQPHSRAEARCTFTTERLTPALGVVLPL